MIFLEIIKRELQIAMRKNAEILNPLWFFLLVITLFPLVIGPDPKLLSRIAPGIAWVAALLSALLSFERLFRDDFIDGSLEQLMLTAQPLPMTALAKVVAHWLLTGLPLILLSPIAALLLSLEVNIWWALVLTLLLGTPVLSCIGAIGVALTVGLRKGRVVEFACCSVIYSRFNFCFINIRSSRIKCALWGTTGDFRCNDGWRSNTFAFCHCGGTAN